MNDREQKANELLLEIAQCSIAQRHLGGSSMSHPCSKILGVQLTADWARFQIPEPWSGDIVRAPILFLSSNPSINSYEAYPTGFQGANSLRSYFSERFNGYWIRNGVYPRNADTAQADYGDAVRYWASMQRRATELWGRTASPGKDYALSEIVHCKSRNEQGVREALSFCAERFSKGYFNVRELWSLSWWEERFLGIGTSYPLGIPATTSLRSLVYRIGVELHSSRWRA